MDDAAPIGPDDGEPRVFDGDTFAFDAVARGWRHDRRSTSGIEYTVVLRPECDLADADDWLKTFKECRQVNPAIQRFTGMIYILGRPRERTLARYEATEGTVEFFSDGRGRLRAVNGDPFTNPLRDTIHHEAGHFLCGQYKRALMALVHDLQSNRRVQAVWTMAHCIDEFYLPWLVRRWQSRPQLCPTRRLVDEFLTEVYVTQKIYGLSWRRGVWPLLDQARDWLVGREIEPAHRDDVERRLHTFHYLCELEDRVSRQSDPHLNRD
ncbi:MAG: hypothetical protein PHV34_08830 [Verrucomicrobiae bacterium]|nr:hypothetical protein [Verrucomicrobiae bacterium]